MNKSLEDERFRGITVREAVKKTAWARSTQLTIRGYSPLEIATGRRPPDLLDVETTYNVWPSELIKKHDKPQI